MNTNLVIMSAVLSSSNDLTNVASATNATSLSLFLDPIQKQSEKQERHHHHHHNHHHHHHHQEIEDDSIMMRNQDDDDEDENDDENEDDDDDDTYHPKEEEKDPDDNDPEIEDVFIENNEDENDDLIAARILASASLSTPTKQLKRQSTSVQKGLCQFVALNATTASDATENMPKEVESNTSTFVNNGNNNHHHNNNNHNNNCRSMLPNEIGSNPIKFASASNSSSSSTSSCSSSSGCSGSSTVTANTNKKSLSSTHTTTASGSLKSTASSSSSTSSSTNSSSSSSSSNSSPHIIDKSHPLLNGHQRDPLLTLNISTNVPTTSLLSSHTSSSSSSASSNTLKFQSPVTNATPSQTSLSNPTDTATSSSHHHHHKQDPTMPPQQTPNTSSATTITTTTPTTPTSTTTTITTNKTPSTTTNTTPTTTQISTPTTTTTPQIPASTSNGHHHNHHQSSISTVTASFNIEHELIKYTKTLKLNTQSYLHHYKLGEHIRNGGFSEIYEGISAKSKEKVIVKLIPKQKTKNWLMVHNKKYPAEILLHKMSNNITGVVKMIEFFEEEHEWVIIMPKMINCMDLFDYLESKHRGRLSEAEACHFFLQLIRINMDLLNHGIVHRDLKSENLLVDLNTMKLILIDFGASAIHRKSSANHVYTDFHGTRQYKPPEYIKSKAYSAQSSTIWTMGVLLYDMCNGQLPFETEHEIVEQSVQVKTQLSDEYKHLLFDCLKRDPQQRPNLNQLLEYEWCVKNRGLFNPNPTSILTSPSLSTIPPQNTNSTTT